MSHSKALRIVLATHNAGKVRELADPLTEFGVEVLGLSSFPEIGEIEETGTTFEENALIKARAVAALTGLVSVADDSGLEVDALSKAPGVYSARYAGEPKSDARNNEKLLTELASFPEPAQRRAHFVCVLVLVRSADDPQPLIAEGECPGEILTAPRGEGGFGYDPLFWLPAFGQAMAELSAEQKNQISHRGQAIARLVEHLAPRV